MADSRKRAGMCRRSRTIAPRNRCVAAFRVIVCFLAPALLRPVTAALAESVVSEDWKRQEEVIRRVRWDSPEALQAAIARVRALADHTLGRGPDAAADRTNAELDAVEELLPTVGGDDGPHRDARAQLYLTVRRLGRDLLFAAPEARIDRLLFVRRQWPPWNHQCSHRVGEAQIPGANLCILEGLSPEGRISELLTGPRAEGGIGRPDLSFDGARIVFPHAERRDPPTEYGYGRPGWRGGACTMYDLYEIGVDGTGLRQLTDRPDSEDTEPLYLPDGRIAFTSSRDDRFVQCGDWALACGIYTMAPDGSDPQRVTEPKEGEFYPSLLDDGRILYTRWDYVMKAYNVIQQLWTVYPDGRNPRLAYGHHYDFTRGPIAFQEARQIPGTSRVLCVGAAHHNTGVGPLLIVDLACHREGGAGLANLTPWVVYPEIPGAMGVEVSREELPSGGRWDAGWYTSPYPLSETRFLACYSFEADNAARTGYGIYLMDVFGNQELVLRLPDASCYSPIPIRPRPVPARIPAESVAAARPALAVVDDVYAGLDGVPRGGVKHLRVVETVSKTVRTVPQRVDVGVNSGWDIRRVLGTVPVDPDGSACFEFPAGRQIFFEALDENYLEVRRMRNFLNAAPGETAGCVGCHEPPTRTPAAANAGRTALRRPPSVIAPPPWGVRGFSFADIVQPVLDRNCVSCHDGSKTDGHAFDLRGGRLAEAPAGYDADQGPQHLVSTSFLALLPHVSYIRVGGYQGAKLPSAVGAVGSGASPLMRHLRKGHRDVRLSLDDWRAFAAWIDCNAPFLGDWGDVCTVMDLPQTPPEPRPLSEDEKARIQARERELAASNAGMRLCAYLNCGVAVAAGRPDAERLRLMRGKTWIYAGREKTGPETYVASEIVFDEHKILIDILGLAPERRYVVGFSWWDFNAADRRQSVSIKDIAPLPGPGTVVIRPTGLPDYLRSGKLAESRRVSLNEFAPGKTECRLLVENAGGVNAVLSEVWLLEEIGENLTGE